MLRNTHKKYVTVYQQGNPTARTGRVYYVDYDVVDEVEKKFVSSKLLKRFKDAGEANKFGERAAKKRDAMFIPQDWPKGIIINGD